MKTVKKPMRSLAVVTFFFIVMPLTYILEGAGSHSTTDPNLIINSDSTRLPASLMPQSVFEDAQVKNTASTTIPAPTVLPRACLTEDSLQDALSNPVSIPANLTGHVFLTASGSSSSDHVSFARLDGSEKRAIGHGSYRVSPAPDGSQVVYEEGDGAIPGGGLYIEDTLTGEAHPVPNTILGDHGPIWSPDGTRIAFVRFDGGSDSDLYVIHPDGTGLQLVYEEAGFEMLHGWFPDSSALLIVKPTGTAFSLRKVDIASGATMDLFTVGRNIDVALSPQGDKIIFGDPVTEAYYGFYVSQINGANRALIGMSYDWSIPEPVWSPDGEWLALSIVEPKVIDGVARDNVATVLLNLQSCQIILLSFKGERILAWTP